MTFGEIFLWTAIWLQIGGFVVFGSAALYVWVLDPLYLYVRDNLWKHR